ncbi:MAG: hypothetical protein OXJ52_01820 [Oligoflexia bacterium]|nr:hypothetical protein [Oligoflexia bacterium]
MSYKEAQQSIIKEEITTLTQFQKWSRSKRRSDNFPSAPWRTYKIKWKGWGQFLGTGRARIKTFMSYKKARQFIIKQGITTFMQFQKWRKSGKRPHNFPYEPLKTYKTEWKGWGQFLGTGRTREKTFMSYKKAQQLIIKQGVITLTQFQKWRKSEKRPDNFPSNPWRTYKTKWKGWRKFLEIGKKERSL